MSKMHGGAPRVRHKVNEGEEVTEIKIDPSKAASIATEALISASVSAVVAKVVSDRGD
jgi:hypothetical protein